MCQCFGGMVLPRTGSWSDSIRYYVAASTWQKSTSKHPIPTSVSEVNDVASNGVGRVNLHDFLHCKF